MAGWENFFIAEVGASAALLGLIFVAVSINLTRIISFPNLPELAMEALVLLGNVLIVSSVLLVPDQSILSIGVEVLPIALIVWGFITFFQVRSLIRVDKQYRRSRIVQAAVGQLATLPFLIAGLNLLLQNGAGLYWIVPGVIFSFIGALLDAWVLLVEINR